MFRRDFFKATGLTILGSTLVKPFESVASVLSPTEEKLFGTAKNVIFLVSDGMSSGTLTMANLHLQRKEGRESTWISLYKQNKVVRSLMDTASLKDMVTDSAASSSAWGGGVRIENGKLNTNPDGSTNKTILQKFKDVGKKVGCITTVPITHATPAGFCIASTSRNQDDIAKLYLPLKFDVMMGGGNQYFSPDKRKDKIDLYSQFKTAGYEIARNKKEMATLNNKKPILGVFDEDALPYSVDYENDLEIQKNVPTLAEMTEKAIALMKDSPNGFALQVEGGKVDWAAHSNDTPGLIYDQIAFDLAVQKAIEFAEKDKNTLVIITTDHGNGNPGLFGEYGSDKKFDLLQTFKHSNDWILNGINNSFSTAQVIERIEAAQGYAIKEAQAAEILGHYKNLDGEGLYNKRKLPFKQLAAIQQNYTAVAWGSMDHSADYVELAAYGPGSEMIKTFVKNTDLHHIMLNATGVKG